MIVYDNRFNANEWFVIIALFIGTLLVFLCPRRFPIKVAIVYYTVGVFTGTFFDHTLSVLPISFYDVNDKSQFQFMDFVSYWMYGFTSYFFFYIYDRLGLKPKYNPIYILIWSLVCVGIEWIGVQVGLYHYNNGYGITISFSIYLFVQSVWLMLFYRLQRLVCSNQIVEPQ